MIVKFIRSEENDSDIMTKNVTADLYLKHSKKLVWHKDDVK